MKNDISREIVKFIKDMDRHYDLGDISPVLLGTIREFIARKGKRLRSILFILAYKGFSRKTASALYRCALSIELLHDFALIHDDIIDRSEIRRGKPTMHIKLNTFLKKHKSVRFDGRDMSIIIGDIIFAMAVNAFLSIDEDRFSKERALKKLIEGAVYTGTGEFIELLSGTRRLTEIERKDIYKIYDLKTAYYSFSYPLSVGATLAGAREHDIGCLSKYGIYIGRAFQLKDDIIDIFGVKGKMDKSIMTDLRQGKVTLLIWHAFQNANARDRRFIRDTISEKISTKDDFRKMQDILINTGSLDYAKYQIVNFAKKAKALYPSLGMSGKYKDILFDYTDILLKM